MNRRRLRIKHLQDALTTVLEYHSMEYQITKAEIVGVLHILAYNTLIERPEEPEDDDGFENSGATGV